LAQAPVPADVKAAHATEAADIHASSSQILSTLVAALGPDQVAELLAPFEAMVEPQPTPESDSPRADPARPPAMTTQVSVSGRLVPGLRASGSASAPRLQLPSAWLPPQLRSERSD
jgi:hypothetical protein